MTDWCGGSWLWKSPAGKESWQWAEQEQSIQAEGVVYRIEKDTRTMIYLKKTILIRSGSSKKYPIRNIKCTGKKEALNSLREGMRVRLEGTLALPELPRNPGQFNRRVYESGKKIDFYLEDPAIVWSKEGSSGSTGMLRAWREEIKKRCKWLYPDTEAGILEAMLFGEKSELTGEVKGFYQAAGISHVLAISGLHISLLALATAGILRRLGLPMPVWVLLSVGVLCGYGILIGQPTTAARALLMFCVLQGGRLLGRSYDLLSALAFAGILMLLDNPDLVADGGCKLSFCAVIGVGWYVSEKQKIFRGLGKKEKGKKKEKKERCQSNTGTYTHRLVSVDVYAAGDAGYLLSGVSGGHSVESGGDPAASDRDCLRGNGSASGRLECTFGECGGKSGLRALKSISVDRADL